MNIPNLSFSVSALSIVGNGSKKSKCVEQIPAVNESS